MGSEKPNELSFSLNDKQGRLSIAVTMQVQGSPPTNKGWIVHLVSPEGAWAGEGETYIGAIMIALGKRIGVKLKEVDDGE